MIFVDDNDLREPLVRPQQVDLSLLSYTDLLRNHRVDQENNSMLDDGQRQLAFDLLIMIAGCLAYSYGIEGKSSFQNTGKVSEGRCENHVSSWLEMFIAYHCMAAIVGLGSIFGVQNHIISEMNSRNHSEYTTGTLMKVIKVV